MRGIAAKSGAVAALSLLAAVALLLGGCASSPSTTHVGATATPTWNAPPTATPTAAPPPIRSFQQAWGAAPIARLATGVANDQEAFNFRNAVTPDGQWLIGEVSARDYAHPTSIMPYLAAYNVQTRQITRVHALSALQRHVNIVATDGTWFVWQEGDATKNGTPDDVIRIFNWKTGVYRQYTQAMLGGLAIENGRAIWNQITPTEPGSGYAPPISVERLADLNAGTVTTLATNATGAALAWPWAGWGVPTDASGNGGGYLQFKNLVTGQTTQSAPVVGQTIQSLAGGLSLHGVTAVFTMYYGAEVDEIPDVSRDDTPQTIFDNTKPGLGPASINGRLVAWEASTGSPVPMVFDSAERALVTLPTTSGQIYIAWTGANVLVWWQPVSQAQQQADEAAGLQSLDTLCVVDTSALPTASPA